MPPQPGQIDSNASQTVNVVLLIRRTAARAPHPSTSSPALPTLRIVSCAECSADILDSIEPHCTVSRNDGCPKFTTCRWRCEPWELGHDGRFCPLRSVPGNDHYANVRPQVHCPSDRLGRLYDMLGNCIYFTVKMHLQYILKPAGPRHPGLCALDRLD